MKHLASMGWLLALTALSCGARSGMWLDAGADPDANRSVSVALRMSTIWMDCMPGASPSIIGLTGALELRNNGTSPVGPIQLTSAYLLSQTGQNLGSITLKPIAPQVIQPGQSLPVTVEKTDGPLALSIDCQSCGRMVRVELSYAGTGLPPSKVISDPAPVSCAY